MSSQALHLIPTLTTPTTTCVFLSSAENCMDSKSGRQHQLNSCYCYNFFADQCNITVAWPFSKLSCGRYPIPWCSAPTSQPPYTKNELASFIHIEHHNIRTINTPLQHSCQQPLSSTSLYQIFFYLLYNLLIQKSWLVHDSKNSMHLFLDFVSVYATCNTFAEMRVLSMPQV